MNNADGFPLTMFDNIRKHPENYRLLERIPLTIKGVDNRFPLKLNEANPGERVYTAVFLDTETTGMNQDKDKIIELGMVKATFSYDRKILLTVDSFFDEFEDPGMPIPNNIVELTHISDDMVSGKSFDDDLVAGFLSGRPLVIAHNAAFDRPFFDKRFPTLATLSWCCSIKEINWQNLGFGGTKLEFLNLVHGYFYDAHRAYVDCLALLWLMYIEPKAFCDLVSHALGSSYKIIVRGNTYEINSQLKQKGYRFESVGRDKRWYLNTDTKADAEQKKEALEMSFKSGAVNFDVDIQEFNSKTRYKR